MLSTIFSPISPRFSRSSASAAATRVTGSGDSISRVENAMDQPRVYAGERGARRKRKLVATNCTTTIPGGGWGFRRQNTRDRLADDPRLTNLPQLYPIRAV